MSTFVRGVNIVGTAAIFLVEYSGHFTIFIVIETQKDHVKGSTETEPLLNHLKTCLQPKQQTAIHIVSSRQTATATSILRILLVAAGKDIRLKADGVSIP